MPCSEFIALYPENRKRHTGHAAVGWGTMLQAGSIPDDVIGYLNWPNPSSGTAALGSTQPVTEISIPAIFLRCNGRPVSNADNLTAISELIV
jgi:hypothetical protein